MTNKSIRHEVLSYLNSSDMFMNLSTEDQRIFLKRFGNDEGFLELMDVAIAFQEEVADVEAMVPMLFDKNYIEEAEGKTVRKNALKDLVVKEDNVCFIPFQTEVDLASPLIIALDCSTSMLPFESLAKGLMIPCFNLCAQQKRDCIVVPFTETTARPIVLKHGQLHVQSMYELLSLQMRGRARLYPVLKKAIALFDKYKVKQDAELMIVSMNYFDDYREASNSSLIRQLKSQHVELSAITLDEKQFNEEPLHFIDKVFFAK